MEVLEALVFITMAAIITINNWTCSHNTSLHCTFMFDTLLAGFLQPGILFNCLIEIQVHFNITSHLDAVRICGYSVLITSFPFVNVVHRIRSCVLLPLNLLLFLVNFRKFVKHIGKSFLFFFLLSLDSLLTYCDFVFCSLIVRFQRSAAFEVGFRGLAIVERELRLAAPEPRLGRLRVLLDRLVTDGACLDPLVGLEVALRQVEAARLQQALALRLAVALQRDLVLQEIDDLLIPRGRDLVLAVLKMLCAFVFEYFGLLKFSIGVKLPRFFRLLKADQLNLIDQGLVRTHAFVDISVLPKPILMLHCDLSHLVFLHLLERYLDPARDPDLAALPHLEADGPVLELLGLHTALQLNLHLGPVVGHVPALAVHLHPLHHPEVGVFGHVLAVELKQLNLKHQSSISWDLGWTARTAVPVVGLDGEHCLLPQFHGGHALVPALDHLGLAQVEAEPVPAPSTRISLRIPPSFSMVTSSAHGPGV